MSGARSRRHRGTPGAGRRAPARIVAADACCAIGAADAPLRRKVCRRLDGLSRALETAAARVPRLGLRGVRDGPAQRFAC